MPKHTKVVTWRKCKVTKTKLGGYHHSERYTITFPKDFAKKDVVIEGTFIYNPFEKIITFRLNNESSK